MAGASPTPVGDDYEPGQLFQSISGTQAANESFGVSLDLLREGRERVPLHIRITHQTKALERARDHCSHGVPLYGNPAPECCECEIVWHREGLSMPDRASSTTNES